MPVDPRYFAPPDLVSAYSRGLQVREQQQQIRDKRRLADLLPQAMGYGAPSAIPPGGAPQASQDPQRAAIAQIAPINPELFMKLDERQRQQAKDELNDVSGAVQWAMSDPAQRAQRWDQVVDFYSRHAPNIAQYRGHPELAESALVQLGQMGEYLKNAPKPEYKAIEAGGSLIDVSGGRPHVVVAPNPGGFDTGAPVGHQGEVTATGPNGQKLRLNPQSNQWEPIGGQSPPGSGGFL